VSDETLGERLRRVFPDASGRRIKHWLVLGRVMVDGAVTRDPRARVAPGARVTLGAPAPRVAFPAALRLLHEDEAVIVVEKPPGLLTVATERERERTAYRMLRDYLNGQTPAARVFIVHRLDRETSGLLVFAKTPAAKGRLQAQFEARSVERVYRALVEGRVRLDEGTLHGRLVEDRSLRVRQVPSSRARVAGRTAITQYRVLERRQDTTLLDLTLGTGRRHQIRVQLADLGHPIIGDTIHGSRRRGRLRLHAARLGFVHPVTGARVRFDCPPPPELERRGSRV
jgi:23S rRNA pseudouridine1911/1915/1917 synthase